MMSSLKLRATVVAASDIKATNFGANGIKAASYAAWWIKNPPKTWMQKPQHLQNPNQNQRRQQQLHQQKRKQSFSQDTGDLFRNISLHGYSKLFDPELTLVEKLIWLSLHITTMVAMLIVLSFTWERFVAQYVVINLHDPLYSVEKVPFPAVSICSNNRISYSAAYAYAKRLNSKDPRKRGLNYFMDHLKDFSRLYYRYLSIEERGNQYTDVVDEEYYVTFQSFLEEYDTAENETYYDTRKVMKSLTPNCSDIILQCFLAGIEIDCFSEHAFQDGLTTYGPCCTFNTKDSYRKRKTRDSYVLPDLGLTVILNTSSSDHFRTVFSSDGYGVIIHRSDDYPDVVSGGAQEVFPNQGEESYVSIKARLIDTDEALRTYGPTKRRCYFDDEAPSRELLLKNIYSFTNCVTRCRIRSIRTLCNCMPFFMPLDLVDTSDNLVYCTLQHINCLLRYTFKWRNVLTQRQMLPELRRESEESLFCPSCLPSCDDVQYRVSLMSLPLDRFRTSSNYERLMQQIPDMGNFSVLRVHFGQPHSLYYRRVIGNNWFEVISTIGNILSIFTGFSMLAIFEILYFLVKYIIIAMEKFVSQNKNQEKKRRKHRKKNAAKFDEAKLYIYPYLD